MVKTRIRSRTCSLAILAVASFLAVPGYAIDFNWNVAGPADWNVGTNWDPEGPPSGGGGNHAFVNNGGTAEISADIADIQDIFVGAGAGTSGTVNQTGGSTFQGTGSWMFVGQDGGTGTYNLSGGTQNKARLFIGRQAGGFGTFNMNGTGVVDNEELNVGVEGAFGMAHLSDSAVVTTTGLVQVQNGMMTVTDDASIVADGEFWVGQGGNNSGTLNMNSGSIESDEWIAIGRDSSTGIVNLSGDARLAKTGDNDRFITLGGLGSGNGGFVNVRDNAVLESSTGIVLSETAGRFGIINQSGGTVTSHDFVNENFGKSLYVDYSGGGLGQYHLSGGTLNAETIDATTGVFNMIGGTLHAVTFEGNLNQNGGTVAPGSSPGTMTITGNYSLNSGDLNIEIEGLDPGTGYDQLIVTGDVSLAGSLSLAVSIAVSELNIGDLFTIIDNQGPNAVSGMFNGLAEGAMLESGGIPFSISYLGGSGNDVVLTALAPEPASAVLFGLAVLGAIGAFRRRR